MLRSADLFKLRGRLPKQTFGIIEFAGVILIILVWQLISTLHLVPASLFPPPLKVLNSFKELHFEDALVRNTLFSVKLNLLGYLEAVAISIPIGFAVGLIPLFRGLFNRNVEALRFVPLTAVTGLFIAWFGIDTNMKVQFLAFGIIVYLLPIIVQRIDEVEEVYIQTVYTLGASKWQTIRTVYIPAVLSRISDDIRVLVAISWTYIIVAELVNKSGGIGSLAYIAARQSRIDKVFAILIVIILIGFIQDKLFVLLDKLLFPHKRKA
jgi:NitT/TauT family transport system permease protein